MSGTINVNIYAIMVKHGYKVTKAMRVHEFKEDLHNFIKTMDITEESKGIINHVLDFYTNIQYKKLMERLQNKGHVK